MSEQKNGQNAQSYGESLNSLMRGSGIVIIIMGILIMWRGITKMIPITGIIHGGLFTLGGLAIFVVGILFIVLPGSKARKQAKKAKEEALLREKIEKEIREEKQP